MSASNLHPVFAEILDPINRRVVESVPRYYEIEIVTRVCLWAEDEAVAKQKARQLAESGTGFHVGARVVHSEPADVG